MRASIVIGFMCFAQVVCAQIGVTSFLETAISDRELKEVEAAQRYFEENNFNSPLLRELDFRIRTGRDNVPIEEYRMRFGFLNPKEIVANNKYKNVLGETLSLRKAAKINEVLQLRLSLVIERARLTLKAALSDSLIRFYQNYKEALISLESGNDWGELLNVEDKYFEESITQGNLSHKIDINNLLIRERTGNPSVLSIDTSQFISIDQISDFLLNSPSGGFQTDLIDKEYALEESLYEIDKAELWSNIGFVQAEYDVDRGDAFADHMGFQVGVSIPLFNSKKPDLKRDGLDLIEEKFDLENAKAELSQFQSMNQKKLEYLIEKWRHSEEYLGRLHEYLGLDMPDLKTYKSLEQKTLALQGWRIDLLASIWQTYVDLVLNNAEQDGVYKNVLFKSQEVLNMKAGG